MEETSEQFGFGASFSFPQFQGTQNRGGSAIVPGSNGGRFVFQAPPTDTLNGLVGVVPPSPTTTQRSSAPPSLSNSAPALLHNQPLENGKEVAEERQDQPREITQEEREMESKIIGT